MTKESKLYFVLSPAVAARDATTSSGNGVTPAGTWGAGAGGASLGSTASCTLRSTPPPASRAAARIRSRKCPSIHSRVKSLGTVITRASPSTVAPPSSPNQVWNVVSFSASRSRAATSCQTPSAVSSICCSTPAARSFGRGYGCASIPASHRPLNEDFSPCPHARNAAFAGALSPLHILSTAVDSRSPDRHTVALSTAFERRRDVDNRGSQRVPLYSRLGRPSAGPIFVEP